MSKFWVKENVVFTRRLLTMMQKIDGYSFFKQQLEMNSKTADRNAMKGMPAERPGGPAGMQPADTYVRSRAAGGVQIADNRPELSDAAQALLEELKQTYSNMDFFVADYSTEEEAQRYLSRGTKDYSVLIDPETLEKMAADAEVRKQYTDILDGAGQKFDEIKEQLGDEAKNVDRLSISFGDDGSVKYYAHLSKLAERQRERIEEGREQRAEERREERAEEQRRRIDHRPGHRPEDRKFASVSADSIEDLVKQIREIDWDSIEPFRPENIGGNLDIKA